MGPQDVTQLLANWSTSDEKAKEALLSLVYDELRQLAKSYLRRERADHTLQSTALVHEAYLRLVQQDVAWAGRSHFFGIAAQLMRRILCDHARARSAQKRGGPAAKITLVDSLAVSVDEQYDLIALDEALKALENLDPLQARVVEMRFFAGMQVEETAEALGISPATVKRHWATARAFLARALGAPAPSA